MIIIGGKEYESYEHFLAENLSIVEKLRDTLSGLDERLDFLNKTMLRVEAALTGLPVEVPGVPGVEVEVVIPAPVLLKDAVVADMSLDIRRFLIMLYRLGRAYEKRLFDYREIGAGDTDTYPYTVPAQYVFIPHIEEVNYGIQRVFTKDDYEGGDLKSTEPYAIDMKIEWGMTPLSKVITGSFAVRFENTGLTDSWVKTSLIGTLLRESDHLWWRRAVRSLGDKYVGL